MQKTRFVEIDYLRGLAMFFMILVHTNAYYLSDKFALFLWDIGEFSVPAFIFCSAYVFFKNYELRIMNYGFFPYLKKRFVRLLLPYYLFLIPFCITLFFVEPKTLSFNYVLQSVFLVGGIQINWLVILFLEFTFVMPLINFLFTKQKILFYLFAVLSFASSTALIFFQTPIQFKLMMWLPWSVLLIYTIYFVKFQKKVWFFILSFIVSLIIFLITREYLVSIHHSLSQYDNKCPPNLYHIAFGILSITIVYSLIKTNIFSIKGVKQLLMFLSKNSYEIFFVHYLVLFWLLWMVNKMHVSWEVFFVSVFIGTMVVQSLLIYIKRVWTKFIMPRKRFPPARE